MTEKQILEEIGKCQAAIDAMEPDDGVPQRAVIRGNWESLKRSLETVLDNKRRRKKRYERNE